MIDGLRLSTDYADVHLSELVEPTSDHLVLDLVRRNQNFWAAYASDVLYTYSDLEQISGSREDAVYEKELRLGIFNNTELIGLMSLMDYSRHPDTGNWCGIWLDELNSGKGNATVALRSLSKWVRSGHDTSNPNIATSIDDNNVSSIRLFERLGFKRKQAGSLSGQMDNLTPYQLRAQDELK